MEESKKGGAGLDPHTHKLNELIQLGRWKKFTEKLESMTPEEREVSVSFIDPECGRTFLETAELWEKKDVCNLLKSYGAGKVTKVKPAAATMAMVSSVPTGPSMNALAIERIKLVKEYMINFGPI